MPLMLSASLGLSGYSLDFDEDDLKFANNSKVQDVIFHTYADIMKSYTITDKSKQDAFIEITSTNFQFRLLTLSPEEQEYVKKKVSEVLRKPEDEEPMILKRRKDDKKWVKL